MNISYRTCSVVMKAATQAVEMVPKMVARQVALKVERRAAEMVATKAAMQAGAKVMLMVDCVIFVVLKMDVM